MDHHHPVDLLQPVVATLKRVAEPLNVVGGHQTGNFIQTLLEHDGVDQF
jgi:hypothetical protein